MCKRIVARKIMLNKKVLVVVQKMVTFCFASLVLGRLVERTIVLTGLGGLRNVVGRTEVYTTSPQGPYGAGLGYLWALRT